MFHGSAVPTINTNANAIQTAPGGQAGYSQYPYMQNQHYSHIEAQPRGYGGNNVYYAWLRTVSATGVAPLVQCVEDKAISGAERFAKPRKSQSVITN